MVRFCTERASEPDLRNADRLLRDAPLIHEWCERVVEEVAVQTLSGANVLYVTGRRRAYYRRDPTFTAVVHLERDHRYQYARRFLRYLRQLPAPVRSLIRLCFWEPEPVSLAEAALRTGLGLGLEDATLWLERVRREVAELFPRHPIDEEEERQSGQLPNGRRRRRRKAR